MQPFEEDTTSIADASNFLKGDRSDIETFQSDDDEPTTSLARIRNKNRCTGFSDMLPFEHVVALTTVRGSSIFANYKNAVWSEDPKALYRLWDSNPAWRKDIGNALFECLRVLARTGYREEYKQLHALWLPPHCGRARRIVIKQKDQNWIPFLKDTTISMTIAVMVEDSLGRCPKSRKPSRWFEEPSVLQTAICVNSAISPSHSLTKSQRRGLTSGRQIAMVVGKHVRVWSSM